MDQKEMYPDQHERIRPKFCPECGDIFPKTGFLCEKCGYQLGNESTQPDYPKQINMTPIYGCPAPGVNEIFIQNFDRNDISSGQEGMSFGMTPEDITDHESGS